MVKAIEVKALNFSYSGTKDKILSDVNFELEYGSVTLLSGLSGEGKSTLISIVTGIIPNLVSGNLEGEVWVDGVNIKGKKLGQVCRRVGVVLQNADHQIIHKNVEDEIAFGCENFAVPSNIIKEQIDRVCTIMDLDKFKQTRTLSGGQKQRLITASTLATGQKIIILDEPLANLDVESAILLMDSLKQLARAGYAILVAEHRLDLVFPYVDAIWNICQGKVNKIEDKQKYLLSQTLKITDGEKPYEGGKCLLQLEHIQYEVKHQKILKDINLEIFEKERLLILGENGSGKTTLLRILARLNKPTGGHMSQYLDSSFRRGYSGKKWFKSVGVIYQNPNYQLFMPTVEQEISFNAVSKAYANEIIELFHLEPLRKRHPQSLSEGQKRKVSIAAVVAGNPKVLLLDEPTVGQDYQGLWELVKILNALHKKNGNTMITITHDMRCAEALCDRAVILANGKVEEQGGKNLIQKFFDDLRRKA